jgi:hypothetical protein
MKHTAPDTPRGTLWQLPPAAAKADPITSKIAARRIDRDGTRKVQMADTLRAVRTFPGRTSLELSSLTGMDRYTLARRLPDLEKVRAVAKGPARGCGVSGNKAVTWEACE